MSFLIDTNVLCEPTREAPDSNVVSWLASADEETLYLSAVTLAELSRGVNRLPKGRRRERLERWLAEDVDERFYGRVLPFDSAVASEWGRLMAAAEAAGRPMNVLDGMIAATAKSHALTLVTRNVRDFEAVLASVLNPWTVP